MKPLVPILLLLVCSVASTQQGSIPQRTPDQATESQPQSASQKPPGGSDSAQQVKEDTEWVLGHFANWIGRLDAAADAGKAMTYNAVEAKDLAEIHTRARRLAVDWQAVFDTFWDKHTDQDTLAANPRYERALMLAQEMLAISGATQAAISELLKPEKAEVFALNLVDFVGIYKRMEQARE